MKWVVEVVELIMSWRGRKNLTSGQTKKLGQWTGPGTGEKGGEFRGDVVPGSPELGGKQIGQNL